jgi:Trk K+ transport system NAD-binding subunit
MRGHVILAGLGNLGYRTAKLLRDCGLPVVVIELTHNARFATAVRARCPVITGDARLPEELLRAGVSQCAAMIACTNDDVANIQSCLHARRLNPHARIIARVFDEVLAERMSGAFDIDLALSSSAIAAKAFVGAATDERAFRSVRIDQLEYLACRYTLSAPVTSERIEEWRSSGVRILAWRAPGARLEPPLPSFPSLDAGSELVLCGPPDRVREVTRA